ncbi:MAG: PucR family transcriptional regulator [Peptostreptococcaceae bacterium]|nr:PucR family transcriptional regulator [Peptostreptococcaceae bacterium]MDY5739062.1 PucR family transcriptional regulator [Anaerovoracaceae bacterium]SFE20105.1 PucR C-terminal helix-turn-helix domain-containing protein [Peptostreptococcaceae bacterium pGA-8]
MKITVEDCLKLDAFNPSILAAGKRNLGNRVRSVSVLDATDLETAVRHNGVSEQVVLTSFYGLHGKGKIQGQIVKALAKEGISALVIFHIANRPVDVEQSVIDAAERAGLPLIIMPKENKAEYAVVIEQVMDHLLYGDNFRNSLINNTIFHLLNFERHRNFQNALREAAVNNDFQVILLSRDFNPILSIETRHQTTIAEAIRLGKEKDVEKDGVYTFIDVNGVLTYWGPITISGEKFFIFIVDNEDNYSAGEITKLAEIIELAMGMWKYTPERDAKAELIKALIRGNKSLAYSLKDEIELNGEGVISTFYARGVENGKGNSIFSTFEDETDMDIIMINEDDEIYGMIYRNVSGNKKDDELSDKALVNKLFGDLKEGNKSVRIFHTTGIDGIEGAADGFRLISETWSFVESVFPYKRVFTKYELALVSNCIAIQMQGGYLRKTYMDLLEPFKKEMGENKARQLLETLETFVLDAGMNSGKTSEFMGIHTNTVQYRLKRINDVLGVEITGNRVIPGLTMAVALKRLENMGK